MIAYRLCTTRRPIQYLFPMLMLLAPTVTGAELTLRRTGESVVDDRALTVKGSFGQAINGKSFQQDAIVSYAGYQYLGYYDANRRVCLARRKLPEGAWETIRFVDYEFKSNDAHNTISLGLCVADGTIHLAFDHHGSPLHYRRSRPGVASSPEKAAWTSELFGAIAPELEVGKPIRISYPRFWRTPDDGLQFGYRVGSSGNGSRMLVDYDAQSHAWSGTRRIDSGAGVFADETGDSNARNSYPNGYSYGPDGKLHVTWVWREDAGAANHDLMYAYSEDRGRTWMNNAGGKLREPPRVTSPGVRVVDIPRGYGLVNTGGQAVDSQGRVHAILWHCNEETLAAVGARPGESRWGPHTARRNFHYWRGMDGDWRRNELPGIAGNRPKIFVDDGDNAFAIFARRPSEWTGETTYPRGRLTIVGASAASGWTDWQEVISGDRFYVNEFLFDPIRWAESRVLSVIAQDSPNEPHAPTALRVIDFGK